MEKPKKIIHWEESSRPGGDVVLGRFVLPVVIIVWGVFVLWCGTMIYGAVWDMSFDGNGAGFALIYISSAVVILPLVVTGLFRGVRVGWNMIKEANDRSMR